MEGEGCDHEKNREASSFGGETELGDAESESSGEGVEMVTPEADDTEVDREYPVRFGEGYINYFARRKQRTQRESC